MAFTKKRIEFTFQLGTGAFGEDGFNTVTVAALRSQVQIASAGGPSMGMANFRIYGMTPSMMNSLSYIVRASDGQVQIRLNRVQINAGDADPLPIPFDTFYAFEYIIYAASDNTPQSGRRSTTG